MYFLVTITGILATTGDQIVLGNARMSRTEIAAHNSMTAEDLTVDVVRGIFNRDVSNMLAQGGCVSLVTEQYGTLHLRAQEWAALTVEVEEEE